MQRIEPAKPPFPPEVDALINRIVPPGVPPFTLFTTLARDPRLFVRFAGRGLLGRGNVTVRQREIVIDRVTSQCGSEYEWGLHVSFFREECKFTDEEVYSLVHGGPDDPCWTAEEKLLIRMCDSLYKTCNIDQELWDGLKKFLSDVGVMELIILAGSYRTVAYLTNSIQMPLEDFGARFPAKKKK